MSFLYERIFPIFCGQEYATTIPSIFFITVFFLKIGDTKTVFWFNDDFFEFVLVLKGLQYVRVIYNVEEELLCFNLVIKLLGTR